MVTHRFTPQSFFFVAEVTVQEPTPQPESHDSLTAGQALWREGGIRDPWARPAVISTSAAPFAAMSLDASEDLPVRGRLRFATDGLQPYQELTEHHGEDVQVLMLPLALLNASEEECAPRLGSASVAFSLPCVPADGVDDAVAFVGGAPAGWTVTSSATGNGGAHVVLSYSGSLARGASTAATLRIVLTPGTMLVGRTLAVSAEARTTEGYVMKGTQAVATILA